MATPSSPSTSYLLITEGIDTIMHFASQNSRGQLLPLMAETDEDAVVGPKFIFVGDKSSSYSWRYDTNVRSYLYCEDVAEAFEKERRVNDVAKDICKLFDKDPEVNIKFVENRHFNDQRYFLDDVKLKILGWSERTTWEELLKKTMELSFLRSLIIYALLRVRMPISSDLNNSRNFMSKISRSEHPKQHMTVLDELLPISIEMAKRNLRGIWDFTTLRLHRLSFKWANFTPEEQVEVIVAPRSNNASHISFKPGNE
ncbi:LOW QUALITY PROTEIN: hypothetical protein HID58_036392 [Brassica napus]|uniref:Uncharacterized protein n=1 Tax=Brassica napus TaxID=3708 RepID=A0ABQ8C9Q3_BRANA|nr:LOW QUALITY PROTEIN: hypothetical protein HID58_036392 [Brassica napus]